jgi:hypothetical protein
MALDLIPAATKLDHPTFNHRIAHNDVREAVNSLRMADLYPSIQDAVDEGDGVVLLTGGQIYTYSSGLIIPPTVALRSFGNEAILNYTGSGVGITMTQPGNPIFESPRLEGFRLLNSGTGTTGILVQGNNPVARTYPAVRGLLSNLQVSGFSAAGIDLRFALEMVLINVYSQFNQDGLLIRDLSNAIALLGGAYRENTRSGVHIDTSAIAIADFYSSPSTVFESNNQYGLLIDGAFDLLNTKIGGHFENNTTRAIYSSAGTGAATGLAQSSIDGAFISTPNGAADIGIEIVNCSHLNILSTSWGAGPSQLTLGAGVRDVWAPNLRAVTVNNSGLRVNIGTPDTVGDAVGGLSFSGLIKAKRLRTGGTVLTADRVALGAGWGNTATVAIQSNSTDGRFRIAITSNGTGQAANASFVLTFMDGTWGATPNGVLGRGDVATPDGDFRLTAMSPTALTGVFTGIPVAGNVYIATGSVG